MTSDNKICIICNYICCKASSCAANNEMINKEPDGDDCHHWHIQRGCYQACSTPPPLSDIYKMQIS